MFDLLVFIFCAPGAIDFFADEAQFAADEVDEDEPYDTAGEGGFLQNLRREPVGQSGHQEVNRELDEVEVDVDVDNDSESFEDEGQDADI